MAKRKYIILAAGAEGDPVVIYARYSSAKQNEQSIEGQLRFCHEYAERRGFRVVGEYIDRGISGADAEGRPEFQRMIQDPPPALSALSSSGNSTAFPAIVTIPRFTSKGSSGTELKSYRRQRESERDTNQTSSRQSSKQWRTIISDS